MDEYIIEDSKAIKKLPNCSVVQTFPYEERCQFVQNSTICDNERYFFNYVKLLYCGFQPHNDVEQVFSVLAMLSICVLMFTILGITADTFFCPTLKVVSLRLGLSEHLAGVTLLAFGNGSPDIFTSLVGMNDDQRFIFSDLLGSSVFVSTFVSGVICLVSPFRMQGHNIRDICFLILGILCIDYFVITDNHVNIFESLCILFIYVAYLVIILVDQFLLNQKLKKIQRLIERERSFATVENQQKVDKMISEVHIDLVSRHSKMSINVEVMRTKSYNQSSANNDGLFKQFLQSLNPINIKKWRESGILVRITMIYSIPINLILLALIPVVDYEKNRHGWSKLLNTIQLVTMPLLFFLLVAGNIYFYGVPFYVYTMILTLPLALTTLLSTRTDIPPKFHPLFTMYTVFGSVSVLYFCAAEVVNIFDVLGIVTNSSNSFLGCTLLAWGNSISDLIANTTMARQGYQIMGYAACFGGPLFNLMLGLGIPFLFKSWSSEGYETTIKQGTMGENCIIFSAIILFCILIWIVTTDFCARRSLGIYCVFFYMLFFLYALLGDLNLIDTFMPKTAAGYE